ncbi:MAG: hypothetical protein ABIL76_00480 [candidate division WOR-3 bacterium]
MFWLISSIIINKSVSKVADGYYYMILKGTSDRFFVANVMKGDINGNTCEIPYMNIKLNVDGKIIDCIYKPTQNLNEFEVVIHYRK